MLKVEPAFFQFLQSTFHGEVTRSHFVSAYLEVIEEAPSLPVVRWAIFVESFKLAGKVAHDTLLQHKGVSYLLAVSSTEFCDVLSGKQTQRFEDEETFKAVRTSVSQQMVEESVRKKAQSAGDRVCGGRCETALAAGLDASLFAQRA
jgi:hypothetical protein